MSIKRVLNEDPLGIDFSVESMEEDLNNTFNKVYDYIFDLYYSAKNELGY